MLGQKQGPGCFETRLSYCFSLFFSPLFLANSQFFTSLLALLGTSQYQPSLPGPDHSTPGWRSLGIPFCYFLSYNRCVLWTSPQNRPSRAPDCGCDMFTTIDPPSCLRSLCHVKLLYYFCFSLEPEQTVNNTCFLFQPWKRRAVSYESPCQADFFLQEVLGMSDFFWSNKQGKRSKMEVAS